MKRSPTPLDLSPGLTIHMLWTPSMSNCGHSCRICLKTSRYSGILLASTSIVAPSLSSINQAKFYSNRFRGLNFVGRRGRILAIPIGLRRRRCRRAWTTVRLWCGTACEAPAISRTSFRVLRLRRLKQLVYTLQHCKQRPEKYITRAITRLCVGKKRRSEGYSRSPGRVFTNAMTFV